MAIYIGNQKIKDIYFGNQKIKEVYRGGQLVYTAVVEPLILFEENNIPMELMQGYKDPSDNPGEIYSTEQWIWVSSYSDSGPSVKTNVGRSDFMVDLTDYKELVVEASSTGNGLFPSFNIGFNTSRYSSTIDTPYVDVTERIRMEYMINISSLSGDKFLKIKANSSGTDNVERVFIHKIVLR